MDLVGIVGMAIGIATISFHKIRDMDLAGIEKIRGR